jgi:hypothetical protein
VLSAGGTAAGSHSCAASFWEFRHLPYLTLEMSVDQKRHRRTPGVFTHRVTLDERDVCGRFGMPVTTFERTLVDCTTVLSKFQLGANLDDVLVAGGLPAPVQQFRVRIGHKTYYLDYAYPDVKVYLEYYGVAVHGTPSAVAYDAARVSDLAQENWRPLIFTEATSDQVIVDQTRALLRLAA